MRMQRYLFYLYLLHCLIGHFHPVGGFLSQQSSGNPSCWSKWHGIDNNHVGKKRAVVNHDINDDVSSSHEFSTKLVQALDLLPLIEAVSRHTGTRRGRQALLSLVNADYDESKAAARNNINLGESSSTNARITTSNARAQRVAAYTSTTTMPVVDNKAQTLMSNTNPKEYYEKASPIAKTLEEALQEYQAVQEASNLLQANEANSINNKQEKYVLTYPPVYGADSSPTDTQTVAETDYDTWLHLPVEEWTLEHILQAEQIMVTIQQVKEWAESKKYVDEDDSFVLEDVAPILANIGQQIPYDDNIASVKDIITDAVTISRVRSITDPNGRSVRYM